MLQSSLAFGMPPGVRWAANAALGIGLALLVGVLVWQGVTASGVPDPTAAHLDSRAVTLDTALLVFREGLEAILVLAAITASFVGATAPLRRPVGAGAGLALVASVATWFAVVGLLSKIDAPALDIQAATGLLAVIVLLVIMNWFFHRIYWTGWIAHHNRRRREVQAGTTAGSRALLGLGLLGFTAVYREGFEVVLFLQTLRMQAGSGVVGRGVLIGLGFTALVAAATFAARRRLPYKRMLVLTGVLLGAVLVAMVGESGAVLVVMVGESVQEMQLAGWLSTTTLPLPIPAWMGVWFAAFPTAESLTAQALAAAVVLGSFAFAHDVRGWLRRRSAAAA